MIGKKFGRLKILSVYKNEKNRLRCICLCDCGNKSDVDYYNLKSGRTTSCGCKSKEVSNSFKDIHGKRYNDLLVEEKTDKRNNGAIVWRCRCLKCGEYIEATKKQLDRGYIKDCGKHKYEDLIGKKVGELKVISFNYELKKYLCKCSCGNETYVTRSNLLSNHTQSCGHLKNDRTLEYVDGTLPYNLTSKLSKNNTSGIKGVSRTRNNKWISYITLRRKRYTLGIFDKKEDAVFAREKAEKEKFEPIIKKSLEIKKT